MLDRVVRKNGRGKQTRIVEEEKTWVDKLITGDEDDTLPTNTYEKDCRMTRELVLATLNMSCPLVTRDANQEADADTGKGRT